LKLTIGALHHLRREEVVRLEADPLRDLRVLADGPRRAVHRLLQVLHHEPHAPVLPRQVDAHEPVAAPDVHQRAARRVHVREVVPVHQVAHLVALAARQRRHGAAHAPRPLRVAPEGHEHGLLVGGAEGELEARAHEARRRRVGLQRLQDVRRGREDVLGVEAHPGAQVVVLGEEPRGGGVRDDARGGLGEDVVGGGHADDAGEVDGVEGRLGLQLGEGDGALDGDEFC